MNEELKKNLEDQIRYYNENYARGIRVVEDKVYDSLLEQLRVVDPGNELVSKVQNDFEVGGKEVSYGDDPMLSMQKFYDVDKMVKWIRDTAESPFQELLFQPKYDGMSAQYKDGVLSTRGNGHVGKDISSKIRFFNVARWLCGSDSELSLCHSPFGDGTIRGELICSKEDFEKVRESMVKQDGTKYSNGRNFIAGICNPLSSREDDDRNFRAMNDAGITLSFVPHDSRSVMAHVKDVTPDFVLSTFEKFKREVPFDQDGIVVKFVGEEFRKKMGSTEHHPKWAAAFKINDEGVKCRVTGCKWTLGGTDGSLTPTLEIEPTEIGGVVVSNVLAHNFLNMKNCEVGTDGNTYAFVQRSGQVIPFISDVENDTEVPWSVRPIGLEKDVNGDFRCPECGEVLSYREGDVDIYCTNDECPGRLKKRLYNACSKCFDILGIAESTIDKMFGKYRVKKFYQMMDLTVEQIASMDGFATDSAQKLFDSIHSIEGRVTDVQVVASLGIPLIGRHVAKEILSVMPLPLLREASVESLTKVRGFGREKASSLVEGLRKYSSELDELLARICPKQTYSATKKAESEGVPTICFTGEAPIPRSQCQDLAKKNGYEPVSGVNKSLSLLVCADGDSNSTKAQKARKYGIRIMTFDEWKKTLGDVDVAGSDVAVHGNSTVDSILEEI